MLKTVFFKYWFQCWCKLKKNPTDTMLISIRRIVFRVNKEGEFTSSNLEEHVEDVDEISIDHRDYVHLTVDLT